VFFSSSPAPSCPFFPFPSPLSLFFFFHRREHDSWVSVARGLAEKKKKKKEKKEKKGEKEKKQEKKRENRLLKICRFVKRFSLSHSSPCPFSPR